jgi:hypothetical protein
VEIARIVKSEMPSKHTKNDSVLSVTVEVRELGAEEDV